MTITSSKPSRFTSPAVPTARPKADDAWFDSAVQAAARSGTLRGTEVNVGPPLVGLPVVIGVGTDDQVREPVPVHISGGGDPEAERLPA